MTTLSLSIPRTRPLILVVNDEPEVLGLLQAALAREGYRVVAAVSGAEALDLARKIEPDLIISDVVMPGMDGIELCRRLKADAPTASAPVLLASARRKGAGDDLIGLAAGADDYLEMPFRRQELLVKVARLAERYHIERQFRAIVEQAAEIIYTAGLDGHLTSINEAGARFFGHPAAELVGKHYQELFGVEDHGHATLLTERLSSEPWRAIHHVTDSGGVPRHLESVMKLVHDPRGHAVGVHGTVRDASERVEAERRLSASVQQLETLTALATAVEDPLEVEQLFTGLADSITRITDYRTCLVALFTEDAPYRPRVLSYSSNISAAFVALISAGSHPRDAMSQLIAEGVRIEVGELGFASYYPPSHHRVLDRVFPERFKTSLARSPVTAGVGRWKDGDELFVPLMTRGGGCIGFISLDDPRSGRAPDRQSVLPVVAFARQVTQLLAQQQSAEVLAHQAEREALINRITRAVRRSLDPAEVFRAAVDELGSHLGADRCMIYMLDREAGTARNVAEYDAPGVTPAGREYDIHAVSGLIEEIQREGMLAFDDVAQDERIRYIYEHILREFGTRSIMYIAITIGEELMGGFAVSTVRGLRHWRESDVALARAVADQTGIAIRQAELYQRAESTSVREALINRLGQAIRASLDLPKVLHTATHELGRALRASRVYLRPYDPSRPESPVEHEYLAEGVTSIADLTINYAYPIGDHLISTHQSLVVNDALNHHEGPPELQTQVRRLAHTYGARSEILCPLIIQDQFRGTLCIHQTDRVRRWTKDEVALVEAVAAQLAMGVAQAELFQLVARGKQTWEATFDAMSDGVFIFGHARRLLRVNHAGAVLRQTSPQHLLGAGCCDIFRGGGGGCVVDQASDEGRAVTLEYTPDRSHRTLLVTAQPVRDGDRLDGTVCTVRDLSELRKIEAVAREQQSLLTSIMESASEAIYALDPAGCFLWCNSKTVAMSGYAAEEIIGRHHLDLIFEADHEAVAYRFAEALRGVPQNYEMRYVTRDGNVRYAMVDNAPLVVDGRTTGVLGIARDISEQKKERERAAQSEKLRALGQLASGVAHDFNNSLAAILGRAQLLQRMTLDTELTRGLEIIQTAAQDAAVTVRRIRTFARQTEDEAFDVLEVGALLGDAVEITRTRWENEARARGLHYDVRLDATVEELFTEGSASELREVFVNLIVNAVDAMPEGGILSISTQRLGGRGARRLRLLFADTGAGMSAEVSGRIFEPFFTTKGAQGTGLGLFVSYGIIERHQGRMSVASKPGSGTVITIELPLVRCPPPFIVEGARRTTVQAADSLAVLVVDDESIVRDTMTEMLQALGHRAIAVDGGGSAIKALDTQQFDIVFTDLSMPGMDGWGVAREVRRRQSGARVVIVTGHGKDGDSRNNWEEVADGIIAKPFDFTQVEEVLARVRSVTPHVGHVNSTS